MKKKIIFLLAVLAILFVSVLTFEFLSSIYSEYCIPSMRPIPIVKGLLCWELKEKYCVDRDVPSLLFEIRAKREAGKRVSKKDYRQLLEEIVIEVDREEIGGSNGLSCGYFGFVAKDLPKPARIFAKRHELAHILGEGNEFHANKESSLEYPFGFLETTVISIFRTLVFSERPFICRIVILWEAFKVYFLPF